MSTTLSIHGKDIYINEKPTYEGRFWNGHRIEGLLLNSRMVQAIFDDENPETRQHWVYPDTGKWDPDRNTDEFCNALPVYYSHGLRAVTIGLQGGGSNYTNDIYSKYRASAFTDKGHLKKDWLARLDRVLSAADKAGMIVIVSLFYWRHSLNFESEEAIIRAVKTATEHLVSSGHKNLMLEIGNEIQHFETMSALPILHPARVHELIEYAQTIAEKKLPVTASSCGSRLLPSGKWLEVEDFHTPHGNGLDAEELTELLHSFQNNPAVKNRPVPIIINEDSIDIANLEASIACGVSWGYYSQGNGSGYKDRTDWRAPRESKYEELSGYQTLPVNWQINTAEKQRFFKKTAEITGAQI